MTGSVREDIEAAISTLSEEGSGTDAPSPAPPAVDSAPAPAEAPAEATSETPTPETPETKAAAAARARDEKGRFAGKAVVSNTPPPPPGTEGKPLVSGTPPPGASTAEHATAGAAPELRAPQSWKPAAREHWGTLPADVRAEVVRRDREVQQALQEAAPAKRLADAFRQTIAPFEAGIRAEGGEPLEAVRSLFQTAHALRGPQRAQVVARLMAQFDVSEEALVAALQGQPAAQNPGTQVGGYTDPRVDQLFARLEQAQATRQHATQSKANEDVESFATSHEFFHDVRDNMGTIMAMAVQSGDKTMTLERAYTVACRMSDEVAAILEQRKAAKSANASNASTQKARAAASSIKGQPAGATGAPQPNSLRADIEAAMGSLTGR